MIEEKNLLGIICTEAFEFAGIPEVPDHKHGTAPNYSAPKRDARGAAEEHIRSYLGEAEPIAYDLELIEGPDGTLSWVE